MLVEYVLLIKIGDLWINPVYRGYPLLRRSREHNHPVTSEDVV